MYKYQNLTNISVIVLFLLIIAIGINSKLLYHPDTLIVGSWEEKYWQYVKANDSNKKDSLNSVYIDEVVKEKISKHLVIHKSEEWIFKKNATLIIRKKGSENTIAKWVLKGRGHVLKITYKDNLTELYRLKEINKNKLVLHFENNMHVRGIVEIHLKRN